MIILLPLLGGIILGRFITNKKARKTVPVMIEITVAVLLFILGWEVGADGELLASLKRIGLLALASAVFSLAGSLGAAYIIEKAGKR